MKKIVLMLFLSGILAGCNQNKQTTPDDEPVSESSDTTDRMFSRDDVEREQDAVATDEGSVGGLQRRTDSEVEGTYQLVDADSDSCSCDCLEISFNETREICVAEDEIYVQVRYERAEGSMIHMFLEGPANVENASRELPWQEFDRNTPLASIDLQPNGTLVVDWLGFAIDGEVATDYAIYGKKTLEGTYEKQE